MIYLVFAVAIALLCLAALEFYYVLFLEGVVRQHKRRVVELERENEELARELQEAEALLEESEGAEETGEDEKEDGDEQTWPEVLEDGDDYRAR